MNTRSKKKLIFITLTVMFLLLLRIDFRFNATVQCCSDEYDYFIHASTIVFDLDFDYSNQKLREFSYSFDGKSAPIGFVGTGILASPFLYLGSVLSKITNESTIKSLMNYQLLIYSFSSIFYFFLSYLCLFKITRLLGIYINKYKLLLYFSASGLPYYAFERFGMTHSFEVFTICLLIFITIKFYQKDKFQNLYAALVPIIFLISFLTRMSNYFIFFIPFIIKSNLFKKKTPLFKNIYFLISAAISLISFIRISNSIYGRTIFNPQIIYGDTRDAVSSIKNINQTFLDMVSTFINTLITLEFGIFWMNPILFVGLVLTIKNLFRLNIFANLITLLCFAQCFYIVYLWKTTASSFGFRYLLPLVPLSFLIYFINGTKSKFLEIYLIYFSIFSLLGIIFFETTILTQLSTTPETNSFGKYIRYVEPEYVKGLTLSLFNIESYYIIFTTSFLGASLFKLILLIFGIENTVDFLYSFNLPIQNEDFQNYLIDITTIGLDKFIISVLFMASLSYFIVYKLINEREKT
jgi:hypothetical protein